MTRLFLSLYVFIALSLVLLSAALEPLFFSQSDALNPTQKALLTTFEQLRVQPQALSSFLQKADLKFTKSKLTELALGNSIVEQINDDLMVQGFTRDYWLIYLPLPDGDIITVKIPQQTESRSQWWLFSALFFVLLALLIAIWIYPLWRDLTRLIKATVKVNQDGSFDVPKLNNRSPLKGVADALSTLEGKIKTLLAKQRELAGAVTHEFKTPIARLKFALANEEGLSAKQAHEARKDIDELDTLIQEMLDFTRLNAHQTELHIEDIPIIELCEQRVAHFQSIMPGGINLSLQLPAGVISADEASVLTADGFLVARALDNLLSNAMRYAKQTIEVSVHEDDNFIHIHVDDDGPGIADAYKDLVFEAFFRPDSSRNRDQGGSGLGLAIVKRIQDWHAAKCTVSDSSLGGTRLTLTYVKTA